MKVFQAVKLIFIGSASEDDHSCLTSVESLTSSNVSLTFSSKPACPGKTVILTCTAYGVTQAWYYNNMDVKIKQYFPIYKNMSLIGCYEQVIQENIPNVIIYSLLARVGNDTGDNALFLYTSILEVRSEYAVNDTIICSSGNNSEYYVYKVLGEF